jgi:acetyl-CoA carboxylase carboxyltransferase component
MDDTDNALTGTDSDPLPAIPADWQALLGELQQRRDAARTMGGSDKLARRQQRGKLNAREVIAAFVDDGSFTELGQLVGTLDTIPADGLVGGFATLDGKPIVLAVEDFTVKGGSIGHGTAAKRERLALLAAQERVPYVLFLDGAGYRVSNTLERHPYTPNDLQALAALAGQVPTVAVVLGTSAGHGALSGVMMDLLIMLEDACLFAAGPPLVAAALGEHSTAQQLGSAALHARHSGVCHRVASDEQAAFELVRRYLRFLPRHAGQKTPRTESAYTGRRQLDTILQLVPCNGQLPYDMQQVINTLVDANCAPLALQPQYGTSIITCFARLGGYAIGIVANQPQVLAGAITSEAAQKATRFIALCNTFHLPVVFLADNPGILPGTQAEQSGILRHAATLFAAQAALRSPKIHVTLRKAFGFGSSIMAMNPFDQQTLTLAFAGVTLAGLPSIGGANAARVDEATRAQLQRAEAAAAWSSSDNMAYDDIIDPRQLRNALLAGLELAANRLYTSEQPAPKPFHNSDQTF